MITVSESGMVFGEYEEYNIFQIEKSAVYRDLSNYSVKTCEFILLKNNNLLFVEAKTTCPNYFEASNTEEKRTRYEAYVDEIVHKMKDSIELYTSMLLLRHSRDEIPGKLVNGIDGSKSIIFVLVIKKAEKRWIEPFSDVFKRKLRKEMKIWNIKHFLVINEEMAKEKGLIKTQ